MTDPAARMRAGLLLLALGTLAVVLAAVGVALVELDLEELLGGLR